MASTSTCNIDYAADARPDAALRRRLQHQNDNRNLGIGQWDEEERAYTRESDNGFLRLQQIGPLGRRAFPAHARAVRVDRHDHNVRRVEAPTIRVNDAFTRGGAQVAGGQHGRTGVFASDLDYVRGNHTLRTGLQFDASRYRSNDQSNYLGTYTFESLEAFDAGPAAQLHAAHRRSQPPIQQPAGRALRAGRRARAPQPDVERRRPLRGADARQRPRTTSCRASA